MPSYVVKAAPDRDLYLIWSTIVDAPEWVGNRAEIVDYLRATGSSTPEAGVDRADITGTSARDPRWFGWGDEAFSVMEGSPDDGWYRIRRDRLAEYAEALLRDDDAGAQALLECWHRHGEED